MIDEIHEYYEYTKYLLNIDIDKKYSRLQKETVLLDHGLQRILTVLARRILFHSKENIKELLILNKNTLENKTEKVRSALVNYCSPQNDYIEFDELVTENGVGLLYAYREKVSTLLPEEDTVSENLRERNNDWQSKLDRISLVDTFDFSKHQSQRYSYKWKTIDNIIADAIHEGPLKRRTMFIKKNMFDLLASKIEKYSVDTAYFIMLSGYLKSLNHDGDFKPFILQNFANWIRRSSYKDKFDNMILKYTLVGLLESKLSEGKSMKIKISSDALSKIVISDSENSFQENEDYILFSISHLEEFKNLCRKMFKKSSNALKKNI